VKNPKLYQPPNSEPGKAKAVIRIRGGRETAATSPTILGGAVSYGTSMKVENINRRGPLELGSIRRPVRGNWPRVKSFYGILSHIRSCAGAGMDSTVDDPTRDDRCGDRYRIYLAPKSGLEINLQAKHQINKTPQATLNFSAIYSLGIQRGQSADCLILNTVKPVVHHSSLCMLSMQSAQTCPPPNHHHSIRTTHRAAINLTESDLTETIPTGRIQAR